MKKKENNDEIRNKRKEFVMIWNIKLILWKRYGFEEKKKEVKNKENNRNDENSPYETICEKNDNI
jgi:hypothetical protein